MRRINRYIPIRIQNYFYERKEAFLNQVEYTHWESDGYPIPPPHSAKQMIIQKYAQQNSCDILIETGTYLGDTVYSQRKNFSQIISIELSSRFFKAAQNRFKDHPHIKILYGNSGKVLPEIMPGIATRSLFWLDGHYSSGKTARGERESPIFEELQAIFSNNELCHVILIDDARLFNGKRDYPTIEELKTYIYEKNPDYKIILESDILILTKL